MQADTWIKTKMINIKATKRSPAKLIFGAYSIHLFFSLQTLRVFKILFFYISLYHYGLSI